MEELAEEYMLIDAMDWESVPHLTTQPLYYISYSVSAVGAAAFWLDAQENGYDAALDKYLKFVVLDPTMGFQEQFEAVGMENPLSADFLKELAAELEETLDVDARLTPVFFSDVPLDSPYYDDVTYIAIRRGTYGTPDGTFQPEAEPCLAEALQMLFNLCDEGETYEVPFSDTEGKRYEQAAAYCYYYEIFARDADPDTETLEVGGERALDLQTLCPLVCQTLKSFRINTTPYEAYEYTDTVADWAKDAVDYCYENGYIEMAEDGSIGAANPVTRVEMVRIFGYLFDAVYSY